MFDAINSLARSLGERVRNQLIFSIAISWFVQNFNLLIFFLNIPDTWDYKEIFSESEIMFLANHSDGGVPVIFGRGILLWLIYLALVFAGRWGSTKVATLVDKSVGKSVPREKFDRSQHSVDVLTTQLETARQSYSEAITSQGVLNERIKELEEAKNAETEQGKKMVEEARQKHEQDLQKRKREWEVHSSQSKMIGDSALDALYEVLRINYPDLYDQYVLGEFHRPNIEHVNNKDHVMFIKMLEQAGLGYPIDSVTVSSTGQSFKTVSVEDTPLGAELRKISSEQDTLPSA